MPCTSQFNEFKRRQYEIVNFVGLYQSLFINLPLIRNFSPDFESEDQRSKFRELLRSANTFSGFVSNDRFRTIYLELYAGRAVDYFQYYLQEVITAAYMNRPETIESNRKIKVRDVLNILKDGGDINDLVNQIVIRQVESLSYNSLGDFMKHLDNKHGIEVDRDSDEFKRADEFVAVRNIIVHNDGKVNKTFINRTERTDLGEGEDFPLEANYVNDRIDDLESIGRQVDDQLVEKFDLPAEDEITWEEILAA